MHHTAHASHRLASIDTSITGDAGVDAGNLGSKGNRSVTSENAARGKTYLKAKSRSFELAAKYATSPSH